MDYPLKQAGKIHASAHPFRIGTGVKALVSVACALHLPAAAPARAAHPHST